ncbi:YbjN domain-containing protein [Yimella sp. cx-51]|uniref:YbjN domain-containing protein n=1 Tax=Yimella sp. cx-51 TaxID=2770551 RepID=UPI00351C4D36
MSLRAEVVATLERVLADNELDWEPGVHDDEYVVTLPGEKKLKTVVSLTVGDTDLAASAFVIRQPDENHLEFYKFLLRRNLRLPGLAYSIDGSGDVYVYGRAPLAGVDEAYLDRLLGAILQSADEPFNDLLVLGFLSSMKKEWDWRISRGESTRNLEAFRHLLDRSGS